MVEFPFVNALIAISYQYIPKAQTLELHIFSRLVSIAFSLGSLVFLYLLVNRLSGQLVATITAIVFALLPYNIYFSRTTLPEVPLVFFSLAAMYFYLRQGKYYWLSAFAAALAILLKPYAIVLGLPLVFYKLNRKAIAYIIIALTPFIAWRIWIQQFPEGIPAFTWLFNGNGIRFKGAWFRWLFADRFGRLILGYFGLIPLALGLLVKNKPKEGWFYHWWLIGIVVFLSVFATGNVQHDYYQIITIPIISIYVARGLVFLIKSPSEHFSPVSSKLLLITTFAFMLAFSWYHIRDYFNINHPEIVEAGYAADQVLPANAKVIAPYGGDTAFLYQVNRSGWPIGGGIADKIKLGATDYVTTTFDAEALDLAKKCQPSIKTPEFVIISLRNCANL